MAVRDGVPGAGIMSTRVLSDSTHIARASYPCNACETWLNSSSGQVDCNDRRKVFDAGYERGWEERNRAMMALMLEYCPDEMTKEQKAEWARHQQPVSAEYQRAIDDALGIPANMK